MGQIAELGFPHHFWTGAEYLGSDGVFFQRELNDCGGASLTMILDRFGIPFDYGVMCRKLAIGRDGATMLSIKRLGEACGLQCEGWRLGPANLPQVPLPAVLLLRRKHFVVLEEIRRAALILDPVVGRLRVPVDRLVPLWNGETLLFRVPGIDNGNGRWFPGAAPQKRHRFHGFHRWPK